MVAKHIWTMVGQKKRSKMKIEIIFYKFWILKSMLHIRVIIFQKEIKLNVLFIKCYWVHRKKMRFKCVMKLPVHVRIKFNSVVSRYHLMCSTKNGWERVCHNSYWVALFVQNEEKEEKTYGHTIPLNSSDRSTVEQNRPPSIFYFYFFETEIYFCSFVIPIPLTSLV